MTLSRIVNLGEIAQDFFQRSRTFRAQPNNHRIKFDLEAALIGDCAHQSVAVVDLKHSNFSP